MPPVVDLENSVDDEIIEDYGYMDKAARKALEFVDEQFQTKTLILRCLCPLTSPSLTKRIECEFLRHLLEHGRTSARGHSGNVPSLTF